ncbi:MAG: BrnT family toxin [Bauldia sp.]
MRITFDPAKREATLKDRGLDFRDAEMVFAGRVLTVADVRFDYTERRFQTVGHLSGRMVMVVWTPRDGARHVISMRKCNERERKIYGERFEEG